MRLLGSNKEILKFRLNFVLGCALSLVKTISLAFFVKFTTLIFVAHEVRTNFYLKDVGSTLFQRSGLIYIITLYQPFSVFLVMYAPAKPPKWGSKHAAVGFKYSAIIYSKKI